jgi:hypothetical protein
MRRFLIVLSLLAPLPAGAAVAGGGLPNSLPAPGEDRFQELCREMYATEDAGDDWPRLTAPERPYCELRTGGERIALDLGDYGRLVRKGLKFACKNKRPMVYKTVRTLDGCDGATRSLEFDRRVDGCAVFVAETGTTLRFTAEEVAEARTWREEMNPFERFVLHVLAPDGSVVLVDSLAGCGAAEKASRR